ncbi:MAG: ABC transporter ATP-binding protein [Myxococcota bacterium]|nr:ABC transporter ATP-binding protein [Myxococcota bacterium]MEC8382344.1 ABC transporter ATP-binding protein [Myxococcota bacterium]
MTEPIIRFENVCKSFGEKVIYDQLNLEIYRGETLCIIGGSGTGKSVMLKLLVGLLKPDSGKVIAFGEDVGELDDNDLQPIRKQIAMLFQGGALFDSMTVAENIKFPMIEHGWGTAEAMDKRVAEVLTMVGLKNVETSKPAELSGGMRKRVALARSIAVEPSVLLYDEPTTGLDPISIRRINGLIMSLQTNIGVTSLVVTHEMPSVFTIADRIAMVKDRRIGLVGTPEEIKNHPAPWVQQFIAGGDGVLTNSEE